MAAATLAVGLGVRVGRVGELWGSCEAIRDEKRGGEQNNTWDLMIYVVCMGYFGLKRRQRRDSEV